jgi:tRNA pseudouridine38-40 synthase
MKHSNTYKMTIAYDGTHYGGWQIQNNTISIQSLIESALSTIVRKPTPIVASGRTDAGVHALGQVAHFRHSDNILPHKLLFSLNALLPPDIRILSLDPVADTFHARFNAVSKIYHYYLHLDAVCDPFQRLYTYRPPHPIDLEMLKEAAGYFVGTHDFTSFANTRSPISKKGNTRTIGSITFSKKKPLFSDREKEDENCNIICIAFEGNGFLYKMVRNIVGTLLNVCAGKIAMRDIERIFAAKDRRAAGVAAPPQGLFLIEVKY